MGDYEHPIMEPYPSDFDEPLGSEKPQRDFDFTNPPESLLALSPYLHYLGEEWRGKENALKILRKRYKETDSDQEKEWLKAMAAIIKGEERGERGADLAKEINRLEKEIKEKQISLVDANRQSDMGWAKELEKDIAELEKKLSNLKTGN